MLGQSVVDRSFLPPRSRFCPATQSRTRFSFNNLIATSPLLTSSSLLSFMRFTPHAASNRVVRNESNHHLTTLAFSCRDNCITERYGVISLCSSVLSLARFRPLSIWSFETWSVRSSFYTRRVRRLGQADNCRLTNGDPAMMRPPK